VNIDGIALFDKFKSIVGIGSELSTLDKYLLRLARKNNLEITDIPPGFEQTDAYMLSDQISFANEGIPSIMIYEGANYENMSDEEGLYRLANYSGNVYHTPFDDLSQPMNFDAAIQHTRLLYEFIFMLANSDAPPRWHPGVLYRNARLRNKAEGK
jgi:hypothetical protein